MLRYNIFFNYKDIQGIMKFIVCHKDIQENIYNFILENEHKVPKIEKTHNLH